MKYIPIKQSKSNHQDKSKLKGKKKENLKNKVVKIKIIFKSIIIFISFLYDILSFFTIEKIVLVNETEAFNEILSFEKSINLTDDIFYEFLEINEQNKLIEKNIKFENVNKPIISVVMLVYSQAHCLHRCLRSIQNQSLKNIEIIIVDDCSLDTSVELIKEYQKEDPRIILIEHDANRGMIKTRTDGVRIAKGKYIASIDGDDSFIHKDILKNSLYIAEKGNLDIVEFQKYIFRERGFTEKFCEFIDINLDYIIHQPELRHKFISMNKKFYFYLTNRQIIGKLIKNKLYKKALNYVGKKYTEDYINLEEDTIFVISFFHLANSYYLMNEFGYLYYKGNKVEYYYSKKRKECKAIDKLKDFDSFKYVKFLVEKTGNNFKEQFFAYRQLVKLNIIYHIYNVRLDERHFKIIQKILDKALTFEFLTKEQKDYLAELNNKVLKSKKMR